MKKIDELSLSDAEILLVNLYEKNRNNLKYKWESESDLILIKNALSKLTPAHKQTDIISDEEIIKNLLSICENNSSLRDSLNNLLKEPPQKKSLIDSTLILVSIIFVLQSELDFKRHEDGSYSFSYKKNSLDSNTLEKIIIGIMDKFPSLPSFFKNI